MTHFLGTQKRALWSNRESERPCERLAGKRLVVTRIFLPVKKIALDLTGGVFGYTAKAIF